MISAYIQLAIGFRKMVGIPTGSLGRSLKHPVIQGAA